MQQKKHVIESLNLFLMRNKSIIYLIQSTGLPIILK